ncbi:MAG: sortase [Clostridia bacterium]|nr:sortase [Clostridia bacterium]
MGGKHFKKGKHSDKKENKKLAGKIIKIFLLFLLIILIIFGIIFIGDINVIQMIKEKTSQDTIVDIDNIPDKMEGYNVLGVIVIDKLDMKKNILAKTDDSALNISVTKFYGPNLNEVGNFCIAGHNYEDIFERANELELNDTFYIIDKAKGEKVTYKIYDKYSINPTELDCLSQETEGRREVTIITCNPGGFTRLIIKAQEER